MKSALKAYQNAIEHYRADESFTIESKPITYGTATESDAQFSADLECGGTFSRTHSKKTFTFVNECVTWTLSGSVATRTDNASGEILYYHVVI